MKKLFVSVPMKGRTVENIKASIEKMHKIAEILEGEQLELIDSYIEGKPPVNSKEAVWYLGESIKKLSEADVFICVANTYGYNGCAIECRVAEVYDIKRYAIPDDYIISRTEKIEIYEHDRCSKSMTF